MLQYLTGEKQRQSRGWHTKCFSGIRATPSLVLCVGFSGVRATPSLVLCVGFLDRCLSFVFFSFGHCVVCSSSIHGF